MATRAEPQCRRVVERRRARSHDQNAAATRPRIDPHESDHACTADRMQLFFVGAALLLVWCAVVDIDIVIAGPLLALGIIAPPFRPLDRRVLDLALCAIFLPLAASSLWSDRAVETTALLLAGVAACGPRSWPMMSALVAAILAPLAATAVAQHALSSLPLLVALGAMVIAHHDLRRTARRALMQAQRRRNYRLDELLGEGGMGEVWRAWHPGLRRHVALKRLRGGGNADLVARFIREIQATAELTHENTVRILDCGESEDGAPYYTMELLRGRTLQSLVAAEGPLSSARVVHLGAQAAHALAEAHEHGLVHRDVKPENLFVTARGDEGDVIKVLDFGIARRATDENLSRPYPLIREDAAMGITRDGMIVGTPRYMAPEQERGAPADARSDVYSLGASLYLALTGTPPLAGTSIVEVQGARLRGALVPPSWRVASVPLALDRVIMRCLRSDPQARYSDARALAQALVDTGIARGYAPAPPCEAAVCPAKRPAVFTRDLSLDDEPVPQEPQPQPQPRTERGLRVHQAPPRHEARVP
ncbi:MAG TPA: serine/threonine-protein kinase [Myxococcota bacterium]